MSELRYNVISREWVIIASERAKRPEDFKKVARPRVQLPEYKSDCPFCPGNESASEEETFRIPDGRSWKVRSIVNKFPALSPRQELARNAAHGNHSITGFGFHEVIVENPRHNTLIALMSDAEVEDIIEAYLARYAAIKDQKGVEAIVIFKNHGPNAGCSLEHPHSQLVATPIVPPQIRSRMEQAARYFDSTGRCVFCHMMEREAKEKERIVLETEKFVSFVPYASFAPFTTWIVPRRHMTSFDEIDAEETRDLVRSLKTILGKLYRGLENPDFNYTIRSVPVKEKGVEYFHWYVTVIPRLSQPAGFEIGSGIFINVSIPEDNAKFLRGVK